MIDVTVFRHEMFVFCGTLTFVDNYANTQHLNLFSPSSIYLDSFNRHIDVERKKLLASASWKSFDNFLILGKQDSDKKAFRA